MKKCNCLASYVSKRSYYSLNIGLAGTAHNAIEMIWDTGASKTIIYHNFIKGLKGINLIKLKGLKEYLNQEEEMKKALGYYESKYIQNDFRTASGHEMIGILCCKPNVLIDNLLLDKFYFFLVFPKHEMKADELSCLLGTDFISCCERQSHVASDEIFTQFDEDLYEQKYQELIIGRGKEPYNLNLLMEITEESKQFNNSNRANGVNAFL